MQDLTVDPELKSLIPPLSKEEFAQLEQNILQDGCRDPLVVWNNTIIDGHNRYEICQKHDIQFTTTKKEFKGFSDVKIWMLDLAFGQRNLEDWQKYENRQAKKEELEKIGTEKRKRKSESVLSTIDKTKPHDTRKEIAEDLGWSTGKVAMADKVKKEASQEVIEKIKTGEITINKAYQEIKSKQKKESRIEEIQRQVEEIQNTKIPAIKKKFHVISIDPPWPYETNYDPEGRRGACPYPLMSIEEISDLQIPAQDDCVMWLWTTHKFLPDSFELLKKWGFEYKATMVWDKQKIGLGHWLRMQCEFCLLAVKGNPVWKNTKVRDILSVSRREHSRKPDEFFHMVDDICVGSKLEYFSREKRPGWDQIGNDKDKF